MAHTCVPLRHTQSYYYYSDRCADDLDTKLGKHGLDQPSVKWHITAYIHISAYKVLIIIQIVVRMTWKQNWGSMGWINLRSSGTSRHTYTYQHTQSTYDVSDRTARPTSMQWWQLQLVTVLGIHQDACLVMPSCNNPLVWCAWDAAR